MTGAEFDAVCVQILGDNYISWSNDEMTQMIRIRVKKLPNSFQRVALKTSMPAGIRIGWDVVEPDYPLTVDTN